MYSGSTLTRYSGRVMGAHQKIDRIARRQLGQLLPDPELFPSIREILRFEGRDGPDGIKIKSPAQDEPWHYYNPFNRRDNALIKIINDHQETLIAELRAGHRERAAFEAAWQAHALVDGLTPAHHYPYEAKLIELMNGQGLETRTSIIKKNIIAADTTREWLSKNWQMWGPKGLRTAHGLFELGVSTLIAPLGFGDAMPTLEDCRRMHRRGIASYFKAQAREIAALGMFDAYLERGWTPRLAWQVRHRLGPALVTTVTLAWFSALVSAEMVSFDDIGPLRPGYRLRAARRRRQRQQKRQSSEK